MQYKYLAHVMSVPCLYLEPIMSDIEIQEKEGEYLQENQCMHIIKTDHDVRTSDGHLLLRFRKGVIDDALCNNAVEGLREVSLKKHDNRGAPAGQLDRNKMPNYVAGWYNTKKFRTYYTRKSDGQASKHDISNLSPSSIIGFFDRKDRNDPKGLPCRLTAFSAQEVDKWNQCIPLVQRISQLFSELMPEAYDRQRQQAMKSPNFIIKDTCFSTLTTNYSWRTAIHRDKGDFIGGFGNLTVCEDSKNPYHYKGCYTGLPQYGVCVDVRQGDFLAMDVHEWHGNTEMINAGSQLPLEESPSPTIAFPFKERDFINQWHFNRLALVCYLRNNMWKCSARNAKLV